MVESDGWGIAKRMLQGMILDLGDIFQIKTTDAKQVVAEIGSRQMAIETIMSWIKEIEGNVESHKSNRETFRNIREEHIVSVE